MIALHGKRNFESQSDISIRIIFDEQGHGERRAISAEYLLLRDNENRGSNLKLVDISASWHLYNIGYVELIPNHVFWEMSENNPTDNPKS